MINYIIKNEVYPSVVKKEKKPTFVKCFNEIKMNL